MADSRTTPLWSGRFDVEPDADLLAFGASFPFDRRLLEDDVAGSVAWAESQPVRPSSVLHSAVMK